MAYTRVRAVSKNEGCANARTRAVAFAINGNIAEDHEKVCQVFQDSDHPDAEQLQGREARPQHSNKNTIRREPLLCNVLVPALCSGSS